MPSLVQNVYISMFFLFFQKSPLCNNKTYIQIKAMLISEIILQGTFIENKNLNQFLGELFLEGVTKNLIHIYGYMANLKSLEGFRNS